MENKIRMHYNDTMCEKELSRHLFNLIQNKIKEYKHITIFCIGSDRSTGDSVGPLVGTYLNEQLNYENVTIMGTLEDPVHAVNLKDKISKIPKSSLVIGIDAATTSFKNINMIHISNGPVHPGKGIKKVLPSVGNISIHGLTCSSDGPEEYKFKNVRLYDVINISKKISNIINKTFKKLNKNSLHSDNNVIQLYHTY